ncbi:MAG: Ig-like domain-containing protein [Gemmatimonadota bacterium]
MLKNTLPGRVSSGTAIACGATALALVVGCANEQPPPGALPDHDPPRVERIEPAPDSIVPGFDGRVRIRFDEPVRIESASFASQLIASPMEPYSVETGFSDIRIKPRDGWRDSVVYCYEIPAGIRDVLSNQTQTSTQFCFSTGVPFTDSQITGTVLDALTGLPQTAASVLFTTPPDSVPYGALTDTDGRFELRSLPAGSYQAFGFMDQNRNFRVDRHLEPYDSATVTSFDGARPDLLFVLVAPDSTPPRLLRADTPDSITIRIEFDDALVRPQPGQPSVTVSDSITGTAIAVFGFELGEPDEVVFPGAPGTVPDSTALPPDSAAAAPDQPTPADSIDGGVPQADALPTRFVTVRLARGITSGTYRLTAAGFANLRDLIGGGDTTFVADVPAPDTTAAVLDTPGDTLGLPPDTILVPPDTIGAPPDTVGVG